GEEISRANRLTMACPLSPQAAADRAIASIRTHAANERMARNSNRISRGIIYVRPSANCFMQEIEIKFAVKDTKLVTEKLRKLGFRISVGRHLEKNYLFDDTSGRLQSAGKLLRVRKTPAHQTVTY